MLNLFIIIGSIGMLLYGMKLLSEAIQKITGDSLRKMLAPITRNRLTGMLAGLVVTAFIQSSAATTVMIVSFVNSGIITLSEAMAAIMGANVGTTATVWLISIFGFQYNILPFAFPLLALSLPLFQSGNTRRNSWGEFVIGFALIFLSIAALDQMMPKATQYPGFASPLSDLLLGAGYPTVLLSLLLGVAITIIVQSSSASLVLAMFLCSSGWISFEAGCAFVIGANIGTCVTPLLASRSASIVAKRAALGHMFFNLSCAIWSLALFGFLCHDVIRYISDSIGWGYPQSMADPDYDNQVALGLSLFHTLINVVNLCLLLPFNRRFVRLITRFAPDSETQEEPFKLQFISSGLISSGELALVQVQKEASRYAQEAYSMFDRVKAMLSEPIGSERQQQLNEQVRLMEEESDRAEIEIADFLNKISPKTLSGQGEQLSRNLYKIVDELESVADSIYHLSATLYSKSEQRIRFNPELNANITKMFELTDAALLHMLHVLEMDNVPSNALNKAYNLEDEINNFRNQFRNSVLDRFDRQEVEYQQSTFFMMLVNECEKIGDYVINVITATSEK